MVTIAELSVQDAILWIVLVHLWTRATFGKWVNLIFPDFETDWIPIGLTRMLVGIIGLRLLIGFVGYVYN